MPLSTGSQILQDYTLDLLLLPLDAFGAPIRTVAKIVVTATVAAAIGATSISLTSATPVTIKAGTSLSFADPAAVAPYGRQQVLFTADAALTATAAVFAINGLKRPIAASSVAETIDGLLPLAGVTTLDLTNAETQVDTTHFLSGSGTEMAIVRVARTFAVSLIALIGDPCLETLVKPLGALNGALLNRELYAVATQPDGEIFAGAAKIMALNLPTNQNEVKKASFTLAFQGNSFEWYPPYIFA